MSQNEAENGASELDRREFLRNASLGTMMMLMGGIPIEAGAETTNAVAHSDNTGFSTISPPVSCGVIGCGVWGREILQTLATLKNGPVTAICDNYQPFLTRAKESAPNAQTYLDYQKLLDDKSVEAVIVATPSHQHKEIVLAALQAGKHVYCEAPLASSIEDAQAIAKAAKAAIKVNFQPGLQLRSDLRTKYIFENFIRVGATGKPVFCRGQWHKKTSWRRASSNPEREKQINWRVSKATSAGLIGEIGIHQLDRMNWFLKTWPAAVRGHSGIMNWDDGRDVPDTIQAMFEYPGKVNFFYDATLTNSFEADCDVFHGTFAAIMMRGDKAWIFKEIDSPLLGWEVFGSKAEFYKDTGFVLSADATKSIKPEDLAKLSPFADSPLNHALKAFVNNCYQVSQGLINFNDTNPGETEGLAEYMETWAKKGRLAAAGYKEGFEATVCALKANEAVTQGQKIEMQKEWFDI